MRGEHNVATKLDKGRRKINGANTKGNTEKESQSYLQLASRFTI